MPQPGVPLRADHRLAVCTCIYLGGELGELSEEEEEKPNQGHIVDLVSRLLEAFGKCVCLCPATPVPWPQAALRVPNHSAPLDHARPLVGQAARVTHVMVSEKPRDRRGGESLQGVDRPCSQSGCEMDTKGNSKGQTPWASAETPITDMEADPHRPPDCWCIIL